MRFPRSMVERVVREEIAAHVRSMLEAEVVDAHEDESSKEKKGAKNPLEPNDKQGALKARKPEGDKGKEASPEKKGPAKGSAPEDMPRGPGRPPGSKDKGPRKPRSDAPPELPATEDPTDDSLEKDVARGEDDEELGLEKGSISKDIPGKTVQSITQEPKSKILPGASEVVVTFSDTPDPLRILFTKSGGVKFYFRGLKDSI